MSTKSWFSAPNATLKSSAEGIGKLDGLPNCDIQRLQSVLNTAVRLVAGASRWDHVTRLLRDHHWLSVKQRIEYKLCMTVHRCLHGEAPRYLADLITLSAAATARAGLRSATSGSVAVPHTTSSTTWCPPIRCSYSACLEQAAATTSSIWFRWHFQIQTENIYLCQGVLDFWYFSFHFQLHIVRRPCVSRTYIAV